MTMEIPPAIAAFRATHPTRTAKQRLDALDQANRIRSSRATLKRTLKTQPADALLVVANPTMDYRSMRLYDLLLALPGVGESKVQRFCFAARISPVKTLRGLSDRQRSEALAFIRNQYGRAL